MLKYPLLLPRYPGERVLTADNADLFFRCHSAIWSVDHLRPSAALNELCKLLFAKICDERRWQGGRFRTIEADPSQTGFQIRALYADAVRLGEELLGGGVPRGVLEEPLQLSDAALFGVVSLLQTYSFTESGVDVKGAAFQQLTDSAVRSGMGQYFTPEPVVRFMVQIVGVTAKDRVLDPFCGSGHFLLACAHFVAMSPRTSKADLSEFESTGLFGIEKDEHMVRVALTDLLMQGRARVHLRNGDSLLPLSEYEDLLGPTSGGGGGFSVVLTNPPFGKRLPKEAMSGLGEFELAIPGRPTPLEVLGLERAITFLEPGGRLAIVLPHSILTNRSMQTVREYVARTCVIKAIVSLPPETFSRYAGVGQASILLLERKDPTSRESHDSYMVYCRSCRNVGYDQTGRPYGQDELPEIARDFSNWSEGSRGASEVPFVIDVRALVRKGFGPEQHLAKVSGGSRGAHQLLSELSIGVFTGAAPGRSAFTDSGCRILKVGDLTGEGIEWAASGERAWVSPEFGRKHAAKQLRAGDILLTAAAHQRKYIGLKVDIVDAIPNELDLVLCSPEVLVIRPKVGSINPFYLLSWLRSLEGRTAIQSCIRGQTAHLYPGDVRELEIPLPSSGSDEAIASLENRIREALRLREASKALTRDSATAFHEIAGFLTEPSPSDPHKRTPTTSLPIRQTVLKRWPPAADRG